MLHTIFVYILLILLITAFAHNYLTTRKKGADGLSEYYLSSSVSMALKGIAAVVIICHHYSLYRFDFVDHNLFTSLIARNGGNFALVIFLFLSGYGVTKSEIARPNTPRSFLNRRIWKVLKPCLIIYAITFLAYYYFFPFQISQEDIAHNHLNPFIADISAHNISLGLIVDWFFVKMDWYVYTTLVMYLFFFLTTIVYKGNDETAFRKRIYLLIGITAVYYIICCPIYTHNLAHYYRNLWAFVLGVVFGYKPDILKGNKFWGIIFVVLLTLFNWFREGYLYAGAALIALGVLLLIGMTNKRYDINSGFLLFIGGISYYLYLCHRMFYNVLWATDMLNFPLFVILSVVFAVGYKYITDYTNHTQNARTIK